MAAGTGKRIGEGRTKLHNMIVEEDENEQSHGDLRERSQKKILMTKEDEYEDLF